jgi:hypothetical protein
LVFRMRKMGCHGMLMRGRAGFFDRPCISRTPSRVRHVRGCGMFAGAADQNANRLLSPWKVNERSGCCFCYDERQCGSSCAPASELF